MPKSILPLQNRKFGKCEINVENRDYLCNLDLKDAYFSVHLKKKLKEIGSLVRKFVRVPLLLLWFRTDTRNINKIVKSGNDNLTQDKHQNQYLLRRQAINWSIFRSDTYEPRHSNLPSAISRIWINWKECVFTPVQEIFEPGNQLCHSRTFFKQHKIAKSSFKTSKLVKQSTNINSGVDKVDWSVNVNYSSSFTSKVELSFPPNAKNIIFNWKLFLFRQNCFEQKLKNWTEMVGTKLRTIQWPVVNSSTYKGIITDRWKTK